jgi:hypothetical protein
VEKLKFAMLGSNCHSDDWLDWKAQLECGIGADPNTYDDWEILVKSHFNLTYWPYLQAGNNR